MAHVQVTDVSLAFADRDILQHVTLSLSSGDRCALAGANGSGKSTFMKILAGSVQPDSGTITTSKGTSVVYLPQSGVDHHGKTLLEEVELSFEEIRDVIAQMERVQSELSARTEDDSDLHQLLHEQHDLHEQVLASGYYDREAEIDRILTGLGFRRSDFDRKTEEFSGGWQMRIALAKVLLRHPDMLLLDEPTNYLDVEARIWLGSFLSAYSGGVLLVSHDRRFLDQTIDTVWELFLGDVKRYRGSYSQYERKRIEEIEQIKDAYEQQQAEIRRIEDFIRRFRATASKAKQVQSRVKQLEKMERIEIPEHLKQMKLRFPAAPRSGDEVVRCKRLSRRYGNQVVLQGVDLTITRGERVVLVGPNGAGKSTLMRIVAGRDNAHEGVVELGANVVSGFYADDENWIKAAGGDQAGPTVVETIEAVAEQQTDQQIRNLLGSFLFMGDDIYKSVSVLSGGERSRVALLQLLLQRRNLLVLDEPTNHLDMASKEVLRSALEQFGGTIVFVSHDREFAEQLATRVIELSPGGAEPEIPSLVNDFPGDYSYYAWRLEQVDAEGSDADLDTSSDGYESAEAVRSYDEPAPVKLSHQEQKARRSRIQSLQRECDQLIERIGTLESEHEALQEELADPHVYSNGEEVQKRTGRIEEIEAEVEEKTRHWERASEELEGLVVSS